MMKRSALIMAGGEGSRMRRSGSACPKPLVEVLGVSLFERNLYAVLRAGVRDVWVSVPGSIPEVAEAAERRGGAIAAAVGARLQIIMEEEPLGSMGSVAFVADDFNSLLIVNADNLTDLDLAAILDAHETSGAAFTLATHDEPFTIPFGQIEVSDGYVVSYREKPSLPVRVSSAISVLSANGAGFVTRGENIGLPVLANRLLEANEKILSYDHQANWIDINDMSSVPRAESMINTSPDGFELWCEKPDRLDVCLVAISGDHVAVDPHASRPSHASSFLPSRSGVAEGEIDEVILELAAELELGPVEIDARVEFDDIDPDHDSIVRIHAARVRLPSLPSTLDRIRHPVVVAEDSRHSAPRPHHRALARFKALS